MLIIIIYVIFDHLKIKLPAQVLAETKIIIIL